MLDKLFGRKKDTVQNTAPPLAPRVVYRGPNRALDALRRGMWVVVDGKVGVVVGFLADGTVEVHPVAPDGTTPMRYNETLQRVESVCLRVPPGDVRQAQLAEIPTPRRPAPNIAARFGYR